MDGVFGTASLEAVLLVWYTSSFLFIAARLETNLLYARQFRRKQQIMNKHLEAARRANIQADQIQIRRRETLEAIRQEGRYSKEFRRELYRSAVEESYQEMVAAETEARRAMALARAEIEALYRSKADDPIAALLFETTKGNTTSLLRHRFAADSLQPLEVLRLIEDASRRGDRAVLAAVREMFPEIQAAASRAVIQSGDTTAADQWALARQAVDLRWQQSLPEQERQIEEAEASYAEAVREISLAISARIQENEAVRADEPYFVGERATSTPPVRAASEAIRSGQSLMYTPIDSEAPVPLPDPLSIGNAMGRL